MKIKIELSASEDAALENRSVLFGGDPDVLLLALVVTDLYLQGPESRPDVLR